MVCLVVKVRSIINRFVLFAVVCSFIFLSNSSVLAQSKGAILNPLPSSNAEQIGEIHYDLNKEVKVLNFIKDLNDNLSGVNSDLFQVRYKFDEEYVRKWTTQYIPKELDYSIVDLEPGFAKIRQVTSESYNELSALCGQNYKAEVISYKPDYADPNKLSYMVKLKFKLTSPDNPDQLMSMILGYIDGRFLVFHVEKRAI